VSIKLLAGPVPPKVRAPDLLSICHLPASSDCAIAINSDTTPHQRPMRVSTECSRHRYHKLLLCKIICMYFGGKVSTSKMGTRDHMLVQIRMADCKNFAKDGSWGAACGCQSLVDGKQMEADLTPSLSIAATFTAILCPLSQVINSLFECSSAQGRTACHRS
jgi:hypothetical protein